MCARPLTASDSAAPDLQGLRIGMLAPIAWRTPPVAYGPWEQVASMLTEGLVRRGIDVTLFATADSVTSARLESVAPHGYAEDPRMEGRVWEALHVARALGRSAEYDLIHNHLDWLPLAFDAEWRSPLVTTIHGFSGAGILPAYERSRSTFVSISDADRAPTLEYAATIPHGIDLDAFPLGPGGDDLIVFSRIHPDKGIVDAIDIAARAGRRLLIAGIVQDEAYFRECVQPRIDGERVVHLGAVTADDRPSVLGAAAALLHPVHFDEPFGLSVAEAMACGTPVVAYRRGAMAEVVDPGVTGILVDPQSDDRLERAAAAVDDAVALDRGSVRARARARFGIDRMVDAYLDVYRDVIAHRGNPRHPMRARAS
ncbi:glycosyltransferase family 4 protein [Microbacterium sp. QXD-8]|uniref:Glycosyltransferase family 4 protein n=1 Tax=Microbacterium psychrotolerans TaxID=3068321 RepID=A0ABU0Z481_9MICO|nr:glycosyltransferase family 4 protein [Microbacterium sp. QXD-8]MDQ7879400.1 glycosyltransferase family 4 protein [Microbacterium sp. QXD-8]